MNNIHEENELIIKNIELRNKNKELLKRNHEASLNIRAIFKRIDEEIYKCEENGQESEVLFLKNLRDDLIEYDIRTIRKVEELHA